MNEKVNIGISLISFSLPVLIAREKGFFEDLGLDVNFSDSYTEAKSLCSDILNGTLDVGGFVALPIIFDMETKKLGSLRFSSLVVESEKEPFVYLLKKAGTSYSRVKDLRQKRIGVFPTKAFHLWLKIILNKEGLSVKDVEIVEVLPSEQVQSLKEGAVDFLFTNNPTADISISGGSGELLLKESLLDKYILDRESGYPVGSFVFNRDFISKKPEEAQKINKVINKAIVYIRENPVESKKISDKYFTKNTPLLSYFNDIEINREVLQKVTDIYYHNKLFPKPLNASLLIFEPGYLIELKNLKKTYFRPDGLKVTVLEDFNLNLSKGDFVSFLGPNGSGKTTILNIISGFVDQDSGVLYINGKNIETSQVGYVYQDYRKTLFPWRKVIDNIALPLEIQGIAKSVRQQEVRDLCQILEIDIPLDSYPNDLSGGQQQMAAFMSALIKKPELILFDEPFSAIDYQNTILFQKKLLDIWYKLGITILLISHDVDEALFLSKKICLLTTKPAKVSKIIKNPINLSGDNLERQSEQFLEIKNNIVREFNEIIKNEK